MKVGRKERKERKKERRKKGRKDGRKEEQRKLYQKRELNQNYRSRNRSVKMGHYLPRLFTNIIPNTIPHRKHNPSFSTTTTALVPRQQLSASPSLSTVNFVQLSLEWIDGVLFRLPLLCDFTSDVPYDVVFVVLTSLTLFPFRIVSAILESISSVDT